MRVSTCVLTRVCVSHATFCLKLCVVSLFSLTLSSDGARALAG